MLVRRLALSRSPDAPEELRFAVALRGRGLVRSLVHEAGVLLGSRAHLTQLRRLSVGQLSVSDAWPLDALLPLLRKLRR